MKITATLDFAGQIGVKPRLGRLNTDATYTQLISAGFLNTLWGLASQVQPTDFIFAEYVGGSGIFNVSIASNGQITLYPQVANQIISGTSPAFAGGSASNAFTVAGLTSAASGSCVIRTSTNAVEIEKAVPGTNTLTVTFTGDPGASTTVDYIYALNSLT